MPDPISIDLVLSGSGVRLPAHAGAIKAIVESNLFKIVRIGGVSGGAIIGSAFSVFRKECGEEAAVKKLETLAVETEFSKIIKEAKFIRLIRFMRFNGLYTGNKFESFIKEKISDGYMAELQDVTIVTTDILKKETIFISAKSFPILHLHTALRRSMSIPFIFVPTYPEVNKTQRCFVDGGVTNNYPIDMFDDIKRPTIGIKLKGHPKELKPGHTLGLIDYSVAIVDTMMTALEQKHVSDAHWANTIQIDTANIESNDFDITRKEREWLFNQGYEQAVAVIEKKFGKRINP